MSGFVGILNLDGAPVDRDLLWQMTRHLDARGPDAQEIWTSGNVGLGHALLRTTRESETENQPCTLDGEVWIAGDCRVDARQDLLRELAARGCVAREDAPDPELILHAYALWGESCVDHLLGDLSFAIWDAQQRKLFCARDHFGVKPFLYACVGRTLIVSNTLTCIRRHPAVSKRLDDLAISDLLVFGTFQELDATAFADIRRLPPAHVLRASAGPPQVRRYWNLPEEDEIRYRRRGEYVEHFLELLDAATRDRLRTDQVGVLMSGGLDSPAVAATARRILAETTEPFDLRAHNVFYARLVPDEEGKYSRIAADGIGIPIHHYTMDDYAFPPRNPGPTERYPPEPGSLFDGERTIELHRGLLAVSRVLLTGYGADPFIDLAAFALEPLFRERRYWRLTEGFIWLMCVRRQIPRFGIRSRLRRALRLSRATSGAGRPYPEWLQPDLERQLDLEERWRVRNELPDPATGKPPCELLDPFWPGFMEYMDPGIMGLPGEMRHPFLDLRLARYLRRIPAFPLYTEKSLLRVAMKGVLPREILHRPKAPLAGNPFPLLLPRAQAAWWERYLNPGSGLDHFVDIERTKSTLARVIPATQAVNDHADVDILRLSLRPIGLNLWLEALQASPVPELHRFV